MEQGSPRPTFYELQCRYTYKKNNSSLMIFTLTSLILQISSPNKFLKEPNISPFTLLAIISYFFAHINDVSSKFYKISFR